MAIKNLSLDDQRAAEAVRRAEEIGFPRGPSSLVFANASYGAWMQRYLGNIQAAAKMGASVETDPSIRPAGPG